MKKTLLASMAALLCMGALAADVKYTARVDLNGTKDGIVLEKGAVGEGGWMNNAGWLKDKGQDTQYLCVEFPASSEWKSASFSFTPQKDGKVNFQLLGAFVRDENKTMIPAWVIIDDIKVEGATLVNPAFEEDAKSWWLGGNDKDGKASVVDGGKSGKGVKVWHNAQAVQAVDVKAGKPVMVNITFKKAE